MTFIARQEPFVCEHCGATVEPLQRGSYRNHCPHCLYSKHVDEEGPGDRVSLCGGLMEPIGLDSVSGKGWLVIHRCVKCGKEIRNKAAPDDALSKFFQEESEV
jgi:DNA-directed RNA polymerase subunit RPC12/RpoP